MDLNKLRVFYHVAKAGGVKAASLSLKMGQSSISTSVTALEKELGHKLFARHFRGMRLTHEGNILFESAKKIFSEISLVEDLINGEQREEEGRITIATSYGLASSDWFVDKISDFTNRFSRIKIKIVDYKVDELDSIEADIFICPYIYDRPELIQEKIKTFEFCLVAGKKYLAKYGTPMVAEDLDHHKLWRCCVNQVRVKLSSTL
jgi:DNA-binding transcriptional LysR family regulator